MNPPLLRRWADPAWWRYVRYTYPDRLIVCGGLAAVALAFGGFVTVSALGSGGTSAASPRAQAAASPFGSTAVRTHASLSPAPASTGAVRSLPQHSPHGPVFAAASGTGPHHAGSASASSAGAGRPRSGHSITRAGSAPTQSAAGAPPGTTATPTTTAAASTTATTTPPPGTTVAVTTPVVTVTVPLP